MRPLLFGLAIFAITQHIGWHKEYIYRPRFMEAMHGRTSESIISVGAGAKFGLFGTGDILDNGMHGLFTTGYIIWTLGKRRMG